MKPLLAVMVLLATSVPRHSAQGEEPSQKEIFIKVRSAAIAPTFGGAKVLLDTVRAADITDPDLASYYAISKEFADFCSELGIPRDANAEFVEIILKVNYAAVVEQLTKNGIGPQSVAAQAAKLASRATRLKAQIPVYEELDAKLAERYSLAPPARTLDITKAKCMGQYRWRTTGRTIEFDLRADGTMTAYDRPDKVDLSEGGGLVSEGKGTWQLRDEKLTIEMTHVWAVVFWKEYPVKWIDRAKVTKVTTKAVHLEDNSSLVRR